MSRKKGSHHGMIQPNPNVSRGTDHYKATKEQQVPSYSCTQNQWSKKGEKEKKAYLDIIKYI
uniref:Uncharacterized protein n=1 Tax=Rhizophora mucronata TaxID=61149 RepID=A0A2P2NYH7_RHIMU